jgi:hypothetical protein
MMNRQRHTIIISVSFTGHTGFVSMSGSHHFFLNFATVSLSWSSSEIVVILLRIRSPRDRGLLARYFFVPMPPHVPYGLRGRGVTDFWGWDAHEAQLRCPSEVIYEYEVPEGALNLSSAKLPRPWSPWESPPSRKNPYHRTGNRTRDLMIISQKLLPLDNEAGLFARCKKIFTSPSKCPDYSRTYPVSSAAGKIGLYPRTAYSWLPTSTSMARNTNEWKSAIILLYLFIACTLTLNFSALLLSLQPSV